MNWVYEGDEKGSRGDGKGRRGGGPLLFRPLHINEDIRGGGLHR